MLTTSRLMLSASALPLILCSELAQAQSGEGGAVVSESPVEKASAPLEPMQTDTNAGALQDIIVTARRTSENLQETPVAVTALQSELLAQKQIVNVADLQRVAPSLSVGTGGIGPASLIFLAIRGQAQTAPNSFTDSPVGVYIDGVYAARATVGNLGFLDPAGVEVLRGPQGTLFGRNTTGGALNITSAQPAQRFEGYVKAGYGNFDSKVIEGVLNAPLSDDIAVRVAGRYNERDGYYPNPLLGVTQGAIEGEYAARGSIKWTPASLPLTWNVSGDYSRYRDNGNAIVLAAVNPNGPAAAFYGISQGVKSGTLPPGTLIPLAPTVAIPAGAFADFSFGPNGRNLADFISPKLASDAQRATLFSRDPYVTYSAPQSGVPQIDDQGSFSKSWALTSNLSVELGDITVKSITGYRESDTEWSKDLAGAPASVGGFFTIVRQHQFSQELQLSGKIDALSYIFGLYYFKEKTFELSDTAILYNTPVGSFHQSSSDINNRSIGIFAQGNYQITDRLRATAGLRYTWDRRAVNLHGLVDLRAADPICSIGVNAGQPVSTAPCDDPAAANFKYPAWTASLDYRLSDDTFLYVKTSGASNAGGFNSNDVPFGYSRSFEPENVRDVEAGFKGEFFDRHVRTNLAAFYSWTNKVQRPTNVVFTNPATGQNQLTQIVDNAGNVRTYGVELEVEILPWKGMTLSGSTAYLHARYAAGSRIEDQLVNGAVVQVDRSGEPLIQAPKWTANVSATQEFELDAGTLNLHMDYAYISDRYWDFFTTGDPTQANAVALGNRASVVDGYGLLNASIGFTFRQPAIEIVAFAKNLTEKTYFTSAFNSYTGLGIVSKGIGTPRTYGASVTFRF